MSTKLSTQVEYFLPIGNESIALNQWIGKKISLRYRGTIYCIQCQRRTKNSFQQGYCYPCFQRLLECNLCTIHPEKCRFYEGQCSADDWAHHHCGLNHVVYLANSSGLKVGITRESGVPTRWIDQGATQGKIVARVKNRHQAGLLESSLKKYVADKTQWQKMLKFEAEVIDLADHSQKLIAQAAQEISELDQRFPEEFSYVDEEAIKIAYPVRQYPSKIVSLNFDKNPVVEGVLQGIKGQYLILDTGVISVRKFGGYEIEVEVSGDEF